MPDHNFLPLATDAWIADTHHLTRHERGLYMDLLILMWRSPRGCVPRDYRWLASHLKLQNNELEMLQRIVKEFCQAADDKGMMTQKRLQIERAYVGRRRTFAQKAARSRWTKKLSNGKTTIFDDADAMPPHPHRENSSKENSLSERDALAAPDAPLASRPRPKAADEAIAILQENLKRFP